MRASKLRRKRRSIQYLTAAEMKTYFGRSVRASNGSLYSNNFIILGYRIWVSKWMQIEQDSVIKRKLEGIHIM